MRDYLRERGVLGTSILWFEKDEDGTPLKPQKWRELCLATVTTHDLPPTAGLPGRGAHRGAGAARPAHPGRRGGARGRHRRPRRLPADALGAGAAARAAAGAADRRGAAPAAHVDPEHPARRRAARRRGRPAGHQPAGHRTWSTRTGACRWPTAPACPCCWRTWSARRARPASDGCCARASDARSAGPGRRPRRCRQTGAVRRGSGLGEVAGVGPQRPGGAVAVLQHQPAQAAGGVRVRGEPGVAALAAGPRAPARSGTPR